MTTIRDHMSAWLVVALLALAGLGLWQRDTSAEIQAAVACDGASAVAATGLVTPRPLAWVPDQALAGFPDPGAVPGLAAWEVAEARSPDYRMSEGDAPLPRLVDATERGAAAIC